jgi:KipI family sensor histidine kinase inhibitor
MPGGTYRRPIIVPLGDAALLVRFGDALDEAANRAAIAFARRLAAERPPEVVEIAPSLVSVLVRFDPAVTHGERIAADLGLLLSTDSLNASRPDRRYAIAVRFGGADGPDLEEVADTLGLTPRAFVLAHNAGLLRVLAIGFAPGFAYCGFHPDHLHVPRRTAVRQRVPPGSVLFAARQTAIAATEVPTGWHVIGRTEFSNFEPASDPPVILQPGDVVRFETAA